MPQPFRRNPGQVVKVSPAAVVERQHIAIGIALVASHWAKVEETLGLPFTVLLSGQEPAAFESYHEIFDLSIRHKMFLAAAKKKGLPKELLEEAIQIHAEARRVAKSRNAVVHGIWGIIVDNQESAFLCAPSGMARRIDEFFEKLHDQIDQQEDLGNMPSWSLDFSIDDYMEYKFQDFQDIINRCIALDNRAFKFFQKVMAFSLSAERARRARRRRR